MKFRRVLMFLFVVTSYCIGKTDRALLAASWNPSTVKHGVYSTVIIFTEVKDKSYVGSGVIIDKNIHVLTAAHLFSEDTDIVRVVTRSGIMVDATILAVDRKKDLALIQPKVRLKNLPYSTIQKSNKIWSGMDILVIGHPYENYWTVTAGIVSKIKVRMFTGTHTIETNTLVNPGSSGGPAFNLKGEVVGIVSALELNIFGQRTGIGIIISVSEIHKFLKAHLTNAAPLQPDRLRIGELQ